MKTLVSLLFFSFLLVGCAQKEPVIQTKIIEFPLPFKYETKPLPVKMYKHTFFGVNYIIFEENDFYEVYNRYESYKLNYYGLYDLIVEFNKLNLK